MSAKAGGPVYKGMSKFPDRALFLFSVLIYAFLYAPILVLMLFSFNSSKSTQTWTGFSTEWYVALLRDESIHLAFFNSMKVGVTATLIATVIGTSYGAGAHAPRLQGQDGGRHHDLRGHCDA